MDKTALRLCKARQFRDQVQIKAIVTKYTSNFGLFTRIFHLEGEEVLGSPKCKAKLPLWLEADSHRHDQMNFFCLKMANVQMFHTC
jgi:hypothetical protein